MAKKKKAADKPAKSAAVKTKKETAVNSSRQAWERGVSIPCAHDTSKQS